MGLYLILIGPQGSGKGVQAGFISQEHGVIQLSTGDLFRAMKTRTDALAREIQDTINAGILVSDEQTCRVVQERLEQQDARSGAIFDGFPRTIPQAEWLDQYLVSRGERLKTVLVMDLDLYTAFKRAFGRVTSADGGSYNIYANDGSVSLNVVEHPDKAFPPRLEATLKSTGETLIRRPDDANAHAIIKRIDTYLDVTQALINHYTPKGLVKKVDAAQSIESVRAAIAEILK